MVGLTAGEAAIIKTRMSTSLTYRCKPKAAITPGAPLGPQSICTSKDCPLAPISECSAYDLNNGTSPAPAQVNGSGGSPTGEITASHTGSSSDFQSSRTILPIAAGVAIPISIFLIGIIAFFVHRSRCNVKELESHLAQVETRGTERGFPAFTGSDKEFDITSSTEPARSMTGSPVPTFYPPSFDPISASRHTLSNPIMILVIFPLTSHVSLRI